MVLQLDGPKRAIGELLLALFGRYPEIPLLDVVLDAHELLVLESTMLVEYRVGT